MLQFFMWSPDNHIIEIMSIERYSDRRKFLAKLRDLAASTDKRKIHCFYVYHIPSAPTHTEPPPLSPSPHPTQSLLCLLQPMNLHGHIVTPKLVVNIRVLSWCYGLPWVASW